MADLDRAVLIGLIGALIVLGIRVAVAVFIAILVGRAMGAPV